MIGKASSAPVGFETFLHGVFDRDGVKQVLTPVSDSRKEWELAGGTVPPEAGLFGGFNLSILRSVGTLAMYRMFASDGEMVLATAYRDGIHTMQYVLPEKTLLTPRLPDRLITPEEQERHYEAMVIALNTTDFTPEDTALWAATLDSTPVIRPQAA
jgi:hypothetical protein